MAEIKLTGNMKVKSLKADFKEAFGATLRVYKSASCKGGFADDNATLASIRAEGAKGGELKIVGHMQVGNFEKKIAEMYGIGVQVATADDSVLADDNITIATVGRAGATDTMPTEQKKVTKSTPEEKKVTTSTDAELEAAKAELERIKAEAAKAQAEAEAAKKAATQAEIERIKAETAKAQAEVAKAAKEAKEASAVPASAKANNSNGALCGLFSVAANKKVRFSMGNLQFNPKKYEWRFALHQWDAIGAANSNVSPKYDGWLDLFGYGTSGYMGLEPTETSTGSQYLGSTIANTNNDWGVYNPITNGGNKEGLWRTLTIDEWIYLFYTRANAAKLRAKACVNGINGAIILPDDFYEKRVRLPFDSTPDNFTDNSYDTTQWATLEAAGAIFLPCAGMRKGTQMIDQTSWSYWSSTGYGTYNNVSAARHVYLFYAACYESYKGRPVRLVQDVK